MMRGIALDLRSKSRDGMVGLAAFWITNIA